MNLSTLLADYADIFQDIVIQGLTLNSRSVKQGDVFIALAGSQQHGLAYAHQAIANGARAIVYEISDYTLPAMPSDIVCIGIEQLSQKLGFIADRFYQHPSHSLSVIGITGTNGKTSCSQFLGQLLFDCGIIGTLGWGSWGHLHSTINTTPDALAVQYMLARLRDEKKQAVAMEVSSHGLVQGRVSGVKFKGAVFTNITRDHLDYHGTMEDYLLAKMQLLNVPALEFVVVNLDDPYSHQIIANTPSSVKKWGVSKKQCTFVDECLYAYDITHDLTGIRFSVQWREQTQMIYVPLYGSFNVDNVLCVLAVMLELGISLNTASKKLTHLQPVLGRMECLGGNGKPLIFVDYAHTPDALEKVLVSVRYHQPRQLWVVFGCGGNRDKGKRAQMGMLAEKLADRIIITNDNPRSEDPQTIIQDILDGIFDNQCVQTIPDRALAIQTAIAQAHPDDCIVIAGKGHEDYQEINGTRHFFSDQMIVKKALESQ